MQKFPLWRSVRFLLFIATAFVGYTYFLTSPAFAQKLEPLTAAEREALGLGPDPQTAPVEPPPLPEPTTPSAPETHEAPLTPDPTTESVVNNTNGADTANASADSPKAKDPGSPALPPAGVSGDPAGRPSEATADADEEEDDSIKMSPTESAESYAEARLRRLEEKSRARWSTSVFYTHKAFPDADWRARQYSGEVKNPRFFGLTLQGERILFNTAGLIALGAEVSVFGRPTADRFKHPFPAIISLGAFLSYTAQFNIRQWVVPFIKAGVDGTRYGYDFDSEHIQGVRALPRADAGLHIYLNFLDQGSAGEMYGNYGILRSYLTAAISVTADSSKKDVNLSDRALRLGFRLEY